jgi:RNA polymerase sigma factor (sigma-70 family)
MKSTAEIQLTHMAEHDELISQTVRQERSRLFNFIRKQIPDEEEAEDILQDVFYQLVETYRLMKPVERVSSWLFTVARNKITDRFRKKKAAPVSQLERVTEDGETLTILDLLLDPADGPEAEMLAEMIMEELEAALDELPAAQREAFVLHEIEGQSFEQISQQTGVKVATLISRKRYAVLFLRERLREFYDELMED